MIVAGQTVENPADRRAARLLEDGARDRRRVHPVRGFHRARRSPAGGPRPSRPERALRDHEGHADPEDRRPQVRGQGRRRRHDRARPGAQLLEQDRRRGQLQGRGPPGAEDRVGASRRCTGSPPTARRTASACRTRSGSRSSRSTTSTPSRCRSSRSAMQRAALAVGAPIGRLLGYGATYSRKPATAPAPVFAGRARAGRRLGGA